MSDSDLSRYISDCIMLCNLQLSGQALYLIHHLCSLNYISLLKL